LRRACTGFGKKPLPLQGFFDKITGSSSTSNQISFFPKGKLEKNQPNLLLLSPILILAQPNFQIIKQPQRTNPHI